MKSQKTKSAPSSSTDKGERIAKVLARAGIASRREVERMIADGRISLNGEILETPATLVANTHGIRVDGKIVEKPQATKLWRFHKPKGCVTTSHDPEGRQTVFDLFPENLPRVITIGRLDYNTEGLLLLTNDGTLSRWMELPATGWKRQYRVRVHGNVDEEALKKLIKGITIEGVKYGGMEASLERVQGRNAWLKVAIREGKKREVRNVLQHLGLTVNRLIRVAYGPFELGNLDVGEVAEMTTEGLLESVPENLLSLNHEPKKTTTKKPLKAHQGKGKPKGRTRDRGSSKGADRSSKQGKNNAHHRR